jgi:hypothetical protein
MGRKTGERGDIGRRDSALDVRIKASQLNRQREEIHRGEDRE